MRTEERREKGRKMEVMYKYNAVSGYTEAFGYIENEGVKRREREREGSKGGRKKEREGERVGEVEEEEER